MAVARAHGAHSQRRHGAGAGRLREKRGDAPAARKLYLDLSKDVAR